MFLLLQFEIINDCVNVAAYFNRTNGEYNFIAVNWMEGSGTLNYITARRRVDSVSVLFFGCECVGSSLSMCHFGIKTDSFLIFHTGTAI